MEKAFCIEYFRNTHIVLQIIIPVSSISELKEIRRAFQGLQTLYETYLPKIDPHLVNDLLSRQQKKPGDEPFYMVEIFTKKGTNEDDKRSFILRKTGMVPSIQDRGTHYVTNHKLTLELLKELAEPDDVLEITGEYTGGLTGVGSTTSRLREDEVYGRL